MFKQIIIALSINSKITEHYIKHTSTGMLLSMAGIIGIIARPNSLFGNNTVDLICSIIILIAGALLTITQWINATKRLSVFDEVSLSRRARTIWGLTTIPFTLGACILLTYPIQQIAENNNNPISAARTLLNEGAISKSQYGEIVEKLKNSNLK